MLIFINVQLLSHTNTPNKILGWRCPSPTLNGLFLSLNNCLVFSALCFFGGIPSQRVEESEELLSSSSLYGLQKLLGSWKDRCFWLILRLPSFMTPKFKRQNSATLYNFVTWRPSISLKDNKRREKRGGEIFFFFCPTLLKYKQILPFIYGFPNHMYCRAR